MKYYEKIALVRNFIVFFSLQILLLAVIFYLQYQDKTKELDKEIYSNMQICSYYLDCKEYEYDFILKDDNLTSDRLYKDTQIYSLFELPTIDKYYLKIVLKKSKYLEKIDKIFSKLAKSFLLYALLIAIISFLFSLYTLRPLKRALEINEDFIKDLLHDINTPLSALILNLKLIKKEFGNSKYIQRAQSSIASILNLQENFKAFLNSSNLQNEEFNLKELIDRLIEEFKTIYTDIEYINNISNIKVYTNKEALSRVLSNLIDNASKYNKPNGFVKIYIDNNSLIIEDSGKGIKDVKKVFNRYYKENQRGIGLGMHIVKKISNELNIRLQIVTKIDKGTKVILKGLIKR